jgi:hypothetical protein
MRLEISLDTVIPASVTVEAAGAPSGPSVRRPATIGPARLLEYGRLAPCAIIMPHIPGESNVSGKKSLR